MPEHSGELPQANHESPQIDEVVEQKLLNLAGGEIVDPSYFGFSPEQAKNIHKKFEQRVRVETDVRKLLEGIMPTEALYNPEMPLESIDTAEGPVPIKKGGRVSRAAINIIRRISKLTPGQAMFHKRLWRININPELDAFSTVIAVSRGNAASIVGPILAHEAVHAHQSRKLESLDQNVTTQIVRDAWAMQKKEPELYFSEAVQLVERSRDLAILEEGQAYILGYSLTGGEISHSAIAGLKYLYENYKKGNKTASVGGVLTGNIAQALDQQAMINGIPFSQYSEKGFAPVLDFVTQRLRDYLPRKDRDSEEYINRIQTATCQIIRLLNQAMSHRQIADLIRNNSDSIQSDDEWDDESKKYKFLQQEIERHPSQEQIDDESLVKKFQQQTGERVMKLGRIAKEELIKKQK